MAPKKSIKQAAFLAALSTTGEIKGAATVAKIDCATEVDFGVPGVG